MTRSTAYVRLAAFVLFAALLSGCRGMLGEAVSPEVEADADEVERKAKEVQTISAIAKIEESIAAYVKAERKIPERLEDLVPKYLGEIPPVTGAGKHRETSAVRIYPANTLRDGHVDGTRLRDSGRWGYVYNDRQVIVFVDCTHKASSGRAWYLERGGF